MKKWWNLIWLIKIYLVVIPCFFCFRLILFLSQLSRLDSVSGNIGNIFKAFIMGIRFDVVITGYIVMIPFLIVSTMFVLNLASKYVYKTLFIFLFSLFTVSFAICAADIPYFSHFFSRFSIGAFQWILDSPKFVIGMIAQEPQYFIIVIPLLVIVVLFYRLFKWATKYPVEVNSPVNVFLKIGVSVLFLGLVFLGIRGRIEKKTPIKVGTAYFCNDAFLNQLGLNPMFTLVRSFLDSQDERYEMIHFGDNQAAIEKVQDFLQIKQPNTNYPIARYITPDTISEKQPNVVLIIMESMCAEKMKRHGNPKEITPFLDSLSNVSLYFDHIYTAGVHTYNGIFGALFSYPAIYYQNPMKETSISRYNGLSYTLKKKGYSTCYFTNYDGQFDNVQGFLLNNDFDRIVSQVDYPPKEVKSNLGVPDDFMFRFSIPVIDNLYAKKKPFFCTLLTTSDHGPYIIPEYFKPKTSNIRDQIVEYADWSLKKFITMASQKEWFDNTIFIFVADHGVPLTSIYDISLDHVHTPLIFYAPKLLGHPRVESCLGGQIDIFPTLMGMLKTPYLNNTLGVDLLKEKRPYIFFNVDERMGVLDKEHLLIIRKDEPSKLYRYQQRDKTNYSLQEPQVVKQMEEYIKSNLQVSQYILNNGKMYVDEKN